MDQFKLKLKFNLCLMICRSCHDPTQYFWSHLYLTWINHSNVAHVGYLGFVTERLKQNKYGLRSQAWIYLYSSKPKIAIKNSPVPTRISRIFWMINVVRNPTKNAPNAGFNSFFIVQFLFFESSLSDITVIHFDQIPLKLLIISLTQY